MTLPLRPKERMPAFAGMTVVERPLIILPPMTESLTPAHRWQKLCTMPLGIGHGSFGMLVTITFSLLNLK